MNVKVRNDMEVNVRETLIACDRLASVAYIKMSIINLKNVDDE